jgi:hypothetical protein
MAGMVCASHLLHPLVFSRCAAWPDAGRIGLSVAMLAPLAFFMGIPFPVALQRVCSASPRLLPWAWGVNGFASVVGASGAALLQIHAGCRATTLAAVALYGVALAAFVRMTRAGGKAVGSAGCGL